jgi:preprotein translocase subunit SecE
MDQYTTIAVIITVAVVLLLMWLIGPRPPRS